MARRRQAELRARRRAPRPLSRSARELVDSFLAIAAHELKTPIVALQLQVRLLENDLTASDAPPSIRRALERIDLQSRRVLELTNAILDASRLTHHAVAPRLAAADLRTIARASVRQCRPVARAADCRLTLDAPRPVAIACDGVAIEQVISNLISNAIKYGAGRPVRVRVIRVRQEAVLEVRDGGIGIRRADRVRIFERFVRAAPYEGYGGLGLGLFIVRRIVELHGGRVEVASAAGRGATFTAFFPSVSPGRARARSRRAAGGGASHARRRAR